MCDCWKDRCCYRRTQLVITTVSQVSPVGSPRRRESKDQAWPRLWGVDSVSQCDILWPRSPALMVCQMTRARCWVRSVPRLNTRSPWLAPRYTNTSGHQDCVVRINIPYSVAITLAESQYVVIGWTMCKIRLSQNQPAISAKIEAILQWTIKAELNSTLSSISNEKTLCLGLLGSHQGEKGRRRDGQKKNLGENKISMK